MIGFGNTFKILALEIIENKADKGKNGAFAFECTLMLLSGLSGD
jgi:hypothetical protein